MQAFLDNLPEPERNALKALQLEPVDIQDVDHAVIDFCAELARANFEAHVAELDAKIADPNTPDAEKLKLLKIRVDLRRY